MAENIKPGKKYAKGLRGPDPNKRLFAAYEPKAQPHQLPESLSYEYLFPPIMDQGNGGTCTSFSTSSVVEAFVYKRDKIHLDISQRALYSMTKQYYENEDPTPGCYEGDVLSVLQTYGYVKQSDFPYGNPINEQDPMLLEKVPVNLFQHDHLLKGFIRVNANVNDMKLAMFEHGPLAIGINWMEEWNTPDVNGFLNPNPTQVDGGHEIVLVGYSDQKQAFKLRNSWSTDWGVQGYAWLPFASTTMPDDVYTIGI